MIPPHELKKQDFSKVIRGYDPQEVDAQIEYLMQKYTELYRETNDLEKRYEDLYEKYKEASSDRDTVKTALIDAKKAANQIIGDANEKAELIVRASKLNCDNIINDFRRIISGERQKLLEVQSELQRYKEKLLSECREHMDRIEELTEIADSALYYSTDDELTGRAIEEVKTDVRYAMAEKTQLDNITDDEVAVDLDCFNEETVDNEDYTEDDKPTGVYVPETLNINGSSRLDDDVKEYAPDQTKDDSSGHINIGDKYMEFLEELDNASNK